MTHSARRRPMGARSSGAGGCRVHRRVPPAGYQPPPLGHRLLRSLDRHAIRRLAPGMPLRRACVRDRRTRSEREGNPDETNPVSDPEDRRLRVLCLIKGLGPGGAERLLLSLVLLPRPCRLRLPGRLPAPLEDGAGRQPHRGRRTRRMPGCRAGEGHPLGPAPAPDAPRRPVRRRPRALALRRRDRPGGRAIAPPPDPSRRRLHRAQRLARVPAAHRAHDPRHLPPGRRLAGGLGSGA